MRNVFINKYKKVATILYIMSSYENYLIPHNSGIFLKYLVCQFKLEIFKPDTFSRKTSSGLL